MNEGDVDWFNEKCKAVSELIGRRVKRNMIVAVNATKESLDRARELGIDIVYSTLLD
jgi:signal recognition particle subunit SEC65